MKNSTPLVSVTVVTYNDSKFIEQTLDSVKAQTYENLELIVSDDCSSDDTVEICRHWLINNKERFVRAEILTSAQNMGVTANITKAQRTANGVWIKGIGGDDLLSTDCIDKFVKYTEFNPVARIVQCRLVKINETNDIIGYDVKGPNKYFHSDKTSAYWQHQFLLRKDPVDALGLFKHKQMLEDLDYYDLEFPMQEDVAFAMRATSAGYKVWFIDDYLVKRRMRSESLSGLSDPTIVSKNDLIRADVNKKYFIPHLNPLEGLLLNYRDHINRFFFTHPALNKKSCFTCKSLRLLFNSPYTIVKTIQLRRIIKHL